MQSWSTDVFKADSKETTPTGTVYRVKELTGESLKGRFYPWGLQKDSDASMETAPVEVSKVEALKSEFIMSVGHHNLTSGFPKIDLQSMDDFFQQCRLIEILRHALVCLPTFIQFSAEYEFAVMYAQCPDISNEDFHKSVRIQRDLVRS